MTAKMNTLVKARPRPNQNCIVPLLLYCLSDYTNDWRRRELVDKLFRNKKSSGAIAAACEYKRISTDTALLSTEDAVDFRQMGMKVRRSKAAALLIDCSSAAGKADCEEAVKEQLTAKGGFPGPVPVVRSGSGRLVSPENSGIRRAQAPSQMSQMGGSSPQRRAPLRGSARRKASLFARPPPRKSNRRANRGCIRHTANFTRRVTRTVAYIAFGALVTELQPVV